MQNAKSLSKGSALYDPAIPSAFPLIGREQNLAQIRQQLRGVGNAALTVLYGLPGVGKTALASVVASDPQVRAKFCDGILWAGLGPHPHVPALLSRWGGLLGLKADARLSNTGDWASAIRNAIGMRKMLVIIDDVWQYEDVQALRVGAPNCAHLVTTRFRTIAAQLTPGAMIVEELTREESLLLLERLACDIVSREEKLDLIQAVGGLPLALTLLGNYLRKQAQRSDEPITAVLERLSEASVRLQISEAQTASEDQPVTPNTPSLQSVIAITDQWLPEPARKALYTLSIFPPKPHTFTEEAALAVTESTYDCLDTLSDVGILEYNSERYTLHQVIADYAHIHLHESEKREASSRLITYIADFVEAHRKDYERLDLESHIIYLVLAQAQGKQRELIRLVCAFAPFLILRGEYQTAERHLRQANQAARALNDDDTVTATLLYLGEIEQCLGNYAQAGNSLQEGLTLARQMHNNERICAFLTQLGMVFQEQGNFPQAETTYQEGLTLARNSADQIKICTLLDNLGSLNMRRGEFAKSESYLQEGLALARKIDDRERVGGLLRLLGALEVYRGNFVQARIYLQEGLTIARKLGDREQICALLNNLGLVAAQQGKNVQAKRYYQEGLELARKIGHREQVCKFLINLGDVFVEEDDYVQAEISFQEGLELAQKLGHREGMSILLLNLGMTARKQGHYSSAKSYLQESLTLANQVSRSRIICHILCELGNLSLSDGSIDLADDYFKKMLEMASAGDQELLALAYYGLARVCALQEDGENARLYGNKSVTIFDTTGHRQAAEVREWIKSILGQIPEVEE
jgi:tetratricopeptide (TPR) repeat protein